MNSYKVLILTPEFIPVQGGTGAYVEGLARNFQGDVEVHVVTSARKGFLNQYENLLGSNVTVHSLGKTSYSFFDNFKFQYQIKKNLKRLIKEYSIDLVHSQSALPDLYIHPNDLKIPIITTIHSTIEDQIRTIHITNQRFVKLSSSERFCIIFSPYLKRIENKYYTSERHFIAVSNWTRSQVIRTKRIKPSCVRTIHNGVDTEKFSVRNKEESYKFFPELYNNGKLKILFFSRMNASKGLYIYLEAIKKLISNKDIHFIFAGPGKLPEFRFPKESFSCLGYVNNNIAPYLYNLADIFVLPSFYENFPISVLEAMASGLPVIASDVGGIPEIIQTGINGILIPPGDSLAIQESIDMLATDKILRNDLGANARKCVDSTFNWKNTAAKTLSYYKEILGQ